MVILKSVMNTLYGYKGGYFMAKLFLAVLVIVVSCAGCEKPSEMQYRQNMRAWVGKTPEELFSQWGKPSQILNTDKGQTLVYLVEKTDLLSGVGEPYTMKQSGYQSSFQEMPIYQITPFCQTTFIIQNNVIVNWLYEGNACKAY